MVYSSCLVHSSTHFLLIALSQSHLAPDPTLSHNHFNIARCSCTIVASLLSMTDREFPSSERRCDPRPQGVLGSDRV